MISADEALERLRDGNQRYMRGEGLHMSLVGADRRSQLVGGQTPFAVILGCADSRVPAEMVFDHGLGDLFVIRVAGNIVAPSQVGSVEFALEAFQTPLVVVMGHSCCGAVQGTIDELIRAGDERPQHFRSIIERIQPTVAPLLETELRDDYDALVAAAVRANILASAQQLRSGSTLMEDLTSSGRVVVLGAEYSLESGEVEFYD